jgi:hypothetical protein
MLGVRCTRGGGSVRDYGWVIRAARVTRNVRRQTSGPQKSPELQNPELKKQNPGTTKKWDGFLRSLNWFPKQKIPLRPGSTVAGRRSKKKIATRRAMR